MAWPLEIIVANMITECHMVLPSWTCFISSYLRVRYGIWLIQPGLSLVPSELSDTCIIADLLTSQATENLCQLNFWLPNFAPLDRKVYYSHISSLGPQAYCIRLPCICHFYVQLFDTRVKFLQVMISLQGAIELFMVTVYYTVMTKHKPAVHSMFQWMFSPCIL